MKHVITDSFLFIPTLILVVIVLMYVSNEDHEDAVKAERLYKQRVCAGVWGDYKDIKPVCDAGLNY